MPVLLLVVQGERSTLRVSRVCYYCFLYVDFAANVAEVSI